MSLDFIKRTMLDEEDFVKNTVKDENFTVV